MMISASKRFESDEWRFARERERGRDMQDYKIIYKIMQSQEATVLE